MNKLGKLRYAVYAALALALLALPALAQAGGAAAGDNDFTVNAAKAIGAGIGFGIAAGFAGIGQGLVGKGATEGVARNPGAAGTVQTTDDHRPCPDRITRAFCTSDRVRRCRTALGKVLSDKGFVLRTRSCETSSAFCLIWLYNKLGSGPHLAKTCNQRPIRTF